MVYESCTFMGCPSTGVTAHIRKDRDHIVTGLEGCRKTLYFYNKIREVLCEFVAEEELEQSGEQDSIIVPVGHNVVFDDNNLLEGIINAFE